MSVLSMNRSRVSVIICAYTHDRWLDLQLAIQSIQAQSVQADEIVLVIDHNPSLYLLARQNFTIVKVIENQEKRGLSGARNTGINYCAGEIIIFMDEDAVATPDWIDKLLRSYREDMVIGVGGRVTPLWSAKRPDWFPEEFNWVVGCSYMGLPEELTPVRNPIGCNMSFRREVLLGAGGFRSGIGRIGELPLGCEETELSIRIRQHNPKWTILYQPEAEVYHRVPAWRTDWGYFIRRCYAEGTSKALISILVGSDDGLSSERQYSTMTLPKAIRDGLLETLKHGKLGGLKRSLAIIAGLAITTSGYIVARASYLLTQHLAPSEKPDDYLPNRMAEQEAQLVRIRKR
jgi:glucosyl-dolichyl phosphate glucuronosyltransferase